MALPDYFADRAKRWLHLAKRIGDPELAQTFAGDAAILRDLTLTIRCLLELIQGP